MLPDWVSTLVLIESDLMILVWCFFNLHLTEFLKVLLLLISTCVKPHFYSGQQQQLPIGVIAKGPQQPQQPTVNTPDHYDSRGYGGPRNGDPYQQQQPPQQQYPSPRHNYPDSLGGHAMRHLPSASTLQVNHTAIASSSGIY